MGLNIAEKALLKSLEGQEESGVLDMRPGAREQLEELREKQKDDQSSLFNIFTPLQAAGAMDRETPFGDKLQPTIPTGGSIFSGRQFGDIRGGITEGSVGQRYNVNNPELFFNTVAGQAKATDDNNFFDYLTKLSGGIVDFAKDVGGSFLGGQTGAKAALQFGLSPLLGFGIGAIKGTGLFDSVGRGMAPELQRGLYDEYGGDNLGRLTSGIMQGYNPRGGNLLISAVDRRQNILRNLKNPRAKARGFTGMNLPALDKFIDDQVKVQTDYYGGTGATDVTGSSDYTSTGSPQSMGSARGGAGGRPY